MNARPKPPLKYDDNPPLDDEFFARAQLAAPGETARLRSALESIISAHDAGKDVETAIEHARGVIAAQ